MQATTKAAPSALNSLQVLSLSLPAAYGTIGRSVIILALLAGLAHLLDLVTFLHAMGRLDPSTELNPLARGVFAHAGPAGVAAAKLAIAIAVPGLLAYRARVPSSLPLVRIALVITAAVGSVGFASNLLSVYL
jgi:hypothetical protein